MKRFTLSRLLLPIIGCIVLLSVLFIPGGVSASTTGQRYEPFTMKVHPLYTPIGRIVQRTHVSGGCLNNTAPPRCYDPERFDTAYGIIPLLQKGITGKGRTIIIIDAFQSPTIRHDLALFDQVFGLPNPTLTMIAPDGLTPFDPNNQTQVGWSGEISLDVEWAHAVAPGATIDLVLAKSDSDADLSSVTKYVADNNLGDVISQSFGGNETCLSHSIKTDHTIFQEATNKKISILAATGDFGAAQITCNRQTVTQAVSYPASDPLVTAVGGTSLDASATTGTYNREATWNDQEGATGGGFSTVFTRPTYQNSISGTRKGRGLPDIAFDADPETGVIVIWSSSGEGADLGFVFGGTSASSPEWAGVIALADQYANKRLGVLNNALYTIGKGNMYSRVFHDVTQGNNTVTVDVNGQPVTVNGYNAGKGWDAVIGWGSPIVNSLVPLLVRIS